jgi:hypothetical protein
MPLHVFCCPEGHQTEELFLGSDTVPRSMECGYCGQESHRSPVNRVTVGGMSSLALEAAEQAVFTARERGWAHRMRNSMDPQQRKMGEAARFRSASDLERYEQAMGLRRLDPHGKEVEVIRSDMLDMDRDISVATAEGGVDGAATLIDKQDIQGATGMSDATFARWNNEKEKVDARIKSGQINLGSGDYVDGAGGPEPAAS